MSERLGGIIVCEDKTSSWHFIGFFPDGSNKTSGQQYHVGEKPTVTRGTGLPNSSRETKFSGANADDREIFIFAYSADHVQD